MKWSCNTPTSWSLVTGQGWFSFLERLYQSSAPTLEVDITVLDTSILSEALLQYCLLYRTLHLCLKKLLLQLKRKISFPYFRENRLWKVTKISTKLLWNQYFRENVIFSIKQNLAYFRFTEEKKTFFISTLPSSQDSTAAINIDSRLIPLLQKLNKFKWRYHKFAPALEVDQTSSSNVY